MGKQGFVSRNSTREALKCKPFDNAKPPQKNPPNPQKKSSHCSKAESLAEQSTGQRPVFPSTQFRHACKAVRVLPLPASPANQMTVPLDKGERARACAGRESPPRSRRVPAVPSKNFPANRFGRRPPLNQRRATPYVPVIAPNSLSEGLHEPLPGNARRHAHTHTHISSHCSKAESLADYSTGQRPVSHSTPHRHACKAVRVLPLPTPPANQNNCPP